MSFWSTVLRYINPFADVPDDFIMVRNRDERGKFIADDPDTPDVDEAYVKVRKTAKGKFRNTIGNTFRIKKQVKKR